MKELIQTAVQEAQTLEEVHWGLVKVFEEIKKTDGATSKIGYVAGIITSDGPEQVETNMKQLALWTAKIRKQQGFPIFSATDIFTNDLFNRLPEMALPRQERETAFIGFWRAVLQGGHVTDVFLTPRWNESKGARDEHKTAIASKITVHYVETTLREAGCEALY